MTEEKKQGSGDDAYDKLSHIDDANPEEQPDEEMAVEHKTATEAIEGVGNLTDMQTADKRLFPDLGYPHLNNLMVGRIFPDAYNPMMGIQVKDLLKRRPDMSVAEAIAIVTVAQSVGIDGEGRIDELGLAGVSHEENLEKVKNQALLGP